MNQKIWLVALISGTAGLGLYLLQLGPTQESLVFVTYSTLSAIAIFVGVFLYRPRPLAGWLLFAIGQLANALGDFSFTQARYMQQAWMPEYISGTLYMSGQILFLFGFGWIYFSYRRYITSYAIAQGGIISVGLLALLWIADISPNLDKGFGWLTWMSTLAVPLCLMMFITLAAVFLMTPVGGPWCYRLFFISLAGYGVGYQFYKQLSTVSGPLFTPAHLTQVYFNDFAYSASYLLLGMAFLHPCLRSYRERLPVRSSSIRPVDLILLGSAFWMAPAAYIINHLNGENTDALVIITSMTVIFTLVEWRLARMVRLLEAQNQHLLRHRELLHHQAYHDALTGLPNRAFLYRHLEEVIGRARLDHRRSAVLLMDVDRFKQVNDTLGHDVGDQVLKEMATALMRLKRKDDVVGRWGGDEFMFIMEDGHDNNESLSVSALALANRLEQETRWTVKGDEGEVDVSISIGVCLVPTEDARMQTIIKKADLALYQAKRGTEAPVVIYQ
jgi:diguanylate cyclase